MAEFGRDRLMIDLGYSANARILNDIIVNLDKW